MYLFFQINIESLRRKIKRAGDGSGLVAWREFKGPIFYYKLIIFYYGEKVKKMSKIMQNT